MDRRVPGQAWKNLNRDEDTQKLDVLAFMDRQDAEPPPDTTDVLTRLMEVVVRNKRQR